MGQRTLREELIETDVLCVGGGIAGLMAAIRAAELGAKVVVAEKANTLRSGAGATGCDHFTCYIPEVHGPDIQPIVGEAMHLGRGRAMNFVRTWLEKSFDIVKLWDSWGIPMKHQGEWEFAGHAIRGGGPLIALKYAGKDQKPILTREACKRGVKIVNRVMVYDLLRNDNSIIGAVGINSREEKVMIFRAKSVVLGTGGCVRLYPSSTPGWMFNEAYSPATTGDGRAMAYRAGAEVVNMEIPQRWAGPKYFARCGKATWIGVIRDPQDKPVGPFVTKPKRRYGDAIADAYPSLFEDYAKSCRGPVYMDCRGISDDDYEYMMYWLKHEGNTALINHLKEEGIDVRKNAVEFVTYGLISRGGVNYNEKAETSVRGLYAAGDEYFHSGVSAAATFGWIAGDSAAGHVKQTGSSEIDTDRISVEIEEKKGLPDKIMGREAGATWQEVNIALQQLMYDYAGSIRSETLLQEGLSHLRRLKEKTNSTMIAKNQHELVHCLEALNLFEIGELIFIASNERKETRDTYIRPDYPFINPLMNNKVLICKKIGDKSVVEWREVKC